MDKLTFRLELLVTANQIDNQIKDDLLKVIKYINEEYKIEITEENYAMLITHVAMALSRVKKNQAVEEISDLIYNEIKADEAYAETQVLVLNILNIINTYELPPTEIPYFEMHALTIIKKGEL